MTLETITKKETEKERRVEVPYSIDRRRVHFWNKFKNFQQKVVNWTRVLSVVARKILLFTKICMHTIEELQVL